MKQLMLLLAVQMLFAGGCLADEQPSAVPTTPPGSATDDAETPEPVEHFAIDAGLSVTSRASVYGNLGVLIAPFGAIYGSDGLRIHLGAVAGDYNYLGSSAPAVRVNGYGQSADAMIGYNFGFSPTASLLLMGGGAFQHNAVYPGDPNNPVQGAGIGAKVFAALDLNPTPATKVALQSEYVFLHNSYYASITTGYALFGTEKFLGPEVVFMGDDFFNEWRAGAHLAGLKLDRVEFGVSAGYLYNRTQGPGAYVGIDASTSF